MRKLFLLLALTSFLTTSSVYAQPPARDAEVAGSFYPDNKDELSKMIDKFILNAEDVSLAKPIAGLIVPHAGYVYSGQVAAHAYRAIQGEDYDIVVIIGPFHRAVFPGASVWGEGVWRTPLGEVKVDKEIARAIAKEDASFKMTPQAHEGEHSLEVQIPFLQRVLKDFRIVPITVSDPSLENTSKLADAILSAIKDRNALIVCSTDMSHYKPDGITRKLDEETLKLIKEMKPEQILQGENAGENELCGLAAVLTFLDIAKKLNGSEIKVLKYGTSSDTTGKRSEVVGYGAAALYAPPAPPAEGQSPSFLRQREKDFLLKFARQTLESVVKGTPAPEEKNINWRLMEPRAVFITLKKVGQLRGCIGQVVATEPLYAAVRRMTESSATSDPRFQRVKPEELDDIRIEISILSPPKAIPDPSQIKLGEHGVIIKRGERGGIFLSKVATETGWTKEEFLAELCFQKAGLPPDCWKDPKTEFKVFTVEDFAE